MKAAGLPVLTYHAIDSRPGVTTTDPGWFAETLDVLAAAGYRAVDLEAWIASGRPSVDRGFAVTFDDGLRSILDVAEVVARHRVPATVFLVTDRMGGDNDWPGQPAWVPRAPLLSWSDVPALAALGFRFAAHGRTHVALDGCDEGRLDAELTGARSAIEDHLGRPCRLFAYPYGRATPQVRRAAARRFAAAFGTRLDVATASQNIFDLARIDAYYLQSHAALQRLASGRLEAWLRVRRTLRAARASFCKARYADRSSIDRQPNRPHRGLHSYLTIS